MAKKIKKEGLMEKLDHLIHPSHSNHPKHRSQENDTDLVEDHGEESEAEAAEANQDRGSDKHINQTTSRKLDKFKKGT